MTLILWAVVYLLVAAADELTQPFTGRTADWEDWLADAIGIGVGTVWGGHAAKPG